MKRLRIVNIPPGKEVRPKIEDKNETFSERIVNVPPGKAVQFYGEEIKLGVYQIREI